MRKQVPEHWQPFPAVRDAEHTFLAPAGISSAAALCCAHTPRGIHGLYQQRDGLYRAPLLFQPLGFSLVPAPEGVSSRDVQGAMNPANY